MDVNRLTYAGTGKTYASAFAMRECGFKRVLLTRERQGMIISVPRGVDEEEDPTRNCTYYDAIYEYLLKCEIDEK